MNADGAFLDIGCAGGHLMECIQLWAAEGGIHLEPWGLEISVELAALARERLPDWAARIFVGNALSWRPPTRFDYARTSLDYVPKPRRPDLLGHLLETVVTLNGRLIVGVFNEEVERSALEEAVRSWGFVVAGRTERAHPDTTKLVRRAFWIDAPAR